MIGQKKRPLKLRDAEFSRGVILSALAHSFVGLIFILKISFFPAPDPIDFQRAMRVDMVGLPDKVSPTEVDSAPPNTSPKAKEEPAPEPQKPEKRPEKVEVKEKLPEKIIPLQATDIKKNEKGPQFSIEKKKKTADTKSAIERMKALEKMQSEATKESQAQSVKAAQEARTEAMKNIALKGAVISPGTSLTGVQKLQHAAYLEEVESHVKKFWKLPEWLAHGKYKARVLIRMNDRGFITSIEFTQKSSNNLFDESITEALRASSPLPPPPEKFVRIVEVNGIGLGFPD